MNLKKRYGLNSAFRESMLSLNNNRTHEQINNKIIEYIQKMNNNI